MCLYLFRKNRLPVGVIGIQYVCRVENLKRNRNVHVMDVIFHFKGNFENVPGGEEIIEVGCIGCCRGSYFSDKFAI